jgi:hypothetical protein
MPMQEGAASQYAAGPSGRHSTLPMGAKMRKTDLSKRWRAFNGFKNTIAAYGPGGKQTGPVYVGIKLKEPISKPAPQVVPAKKPIPPAAEPVPPAETAAEGDRTLAPSAQRRSIWRMGRHSNQDHQPHASHDEHPRPSGQAVQKAIQVFE